MGSLLKDIQRDIEKVIAAQNGFKFQQNRKL